ncbi:MAG: 50S ribosomal protein L19e [Candidatus Nitrosocaldus sp.]
MYHYKYCYFNVIKYTECKTRQGKKELWVTKVRAYRRYLKILKDRKEISNRAFWSLYRRIKGGQVRSLAHLRMLVEEERRKGMQQ